MHGEGWIRMLEIMGVSGNWTGGVVSNGGVEMVRMVSLTVVVGVVDEFFDGGLDEKGVD